MLSNKQQHRLQLARRNIERVKESLLARGGALIVLPSGEIRKDRGDILFSTLAVAESLLCNVVLAHDEKTCSDTMLANMMAQMVAPLLPSNHRLAVVSEAPHTTVQTKTEAAVCRPED